MKDATPITAAANRAVLDTLPFHDTADFDDSRRGFIATLPDVEIENAQGRVLGRRYVLNLENAALTYLADRQSDRADATVTLPRAVLDRLVLGEQTIADAIAQGQARVDGDAARVAELFTLFDTFALMFPIVEPKRSTLRP